MVDPPASTSTFSVESALEADIVLDELIACELLTLYDADTPYEDDIAYEDVMAREELTAHEDVPNNEPVTPLPLKYSPLPLMSSEPVITALPLYGNPAPDDTFPVNEPENEPL